MSGSGARVQKVSWAEQQQHRPKQNDWQLFLICSQGNLQIVPQTLIYSEPKGVTCIGLLIDLWI